MDHTKFLLILLALAVAGCSTSDTKWKRERVGRTIDPQTNRSSNVVEYGNGWGHPYAGTEHAVRQAATCVLLEAFAGISGSPLRLGMIPISVVAGTIDSVFSLAADTILLPADILIEPKLPRKTVVEDSVTAPCW